MARAAARAPVRAQAWVVPAVVAMVALTQAAVASLRLLAWRRHGAPRMAALALQQGSQFLGR